MEAVPVVVCERQLPCRARALATHDHARSLGPGGQVERLCDLGDLPVGAVAAGLVERRLRGAVGSIEDRVAGGLGQVVGKPRSEYAPRGTSSQHVCGAGRVDRSRISMSSMCSTGIWSSACSATATWSAVVFTPALVGRSSPASVSPVSSL